MIHDQNAPCQLLTQDHYRRMPWKNGLGETLEIVLNEDRNGPRFRISQAAVVEDGLFSDFAGFHRSLVLLNGDGMQLSHQGADGQGTSHCLTAPLQIARFDGGDSTHATLTNGPIDDLNIMVRTVDTVARVTAVVAPQRMQFSTDKQRLFAGVYAQCACTAQLEVSSSTQARQLQLPADSMLVVTADATLVLQTGSAISIRVESR